MIALMMMMMIMMLMVKVVIGCALILGFKQDENDCETKEACYEEEPEESWQE